MKCLTFLITFIAIASGDPVPEVEHNSKFSEHAALEVFEKMLPNFKSKMILGANPNNASDIKGMEDLMKILTNVVDTIQPNCLLQNFKDQDSFDLIPKLGQQDSKAIAVFMESALMCANGTKIALKAVFELHRQFYENFNQTVKDKDREILACGTKYLIAEGLIDAKKPNLSEALKFDTWCKYDLCENLNKCFTNICTSSVNFFLGIHAMSHLDLTEAQLEEFLHGVNKNVKPIIHELSRCTREAKVVPDGLLPPFF